MSLRKNDCGSSVGSLMYNSLGVKELENRYESIKKKVAWVEQKPLLPSYPSSPAICLRLSRTRCPMPMLRRCRRESTQWLASLSWTIRPRIRILRRHHMPPVYPRVCGTLLLSVVLLMVLLTVSRGWRAVLRGRRYLLMLVLRAGW